MARGRPWRLQSNFQILQCNIGRARRAQDLLYQTIREMPPSTELICYADDTLVVAGGRWWYETAEVATEATRRAVRAIGDLGLRVAPAKTEVLGFFNRRCRGPPPSGLSISVDGEEVQVGRQMKYLGLIIDDQWTFEPHFEIPQQECSGAGIRDAMEVGDRHFPPRIQKGDHGPRGWLPRESL